MTEAEQNRLIVENMGLVKTIAADYRGSGIDFDDLVAEGAVGLVKAARSFNPLLGKFGSYASVGINQEILNAIQARDAQWYPKDEFAPPPDADSNEKIYDWDAWGEFGNATAICERWSKLDASPEDLSILYGDLKDRRDKFAAAFISLTGAQRKLVTWVYLDGMPITQAASELGASYFRTIRMLKKALKTMRTVITRIEHNQTNSRGVMPTSTLPLSAFTAAFSGSSAA